MGVIMCASWYTRVRSGCVCTLRLGWCLTVEQWQDWDPQCWKCLSCDPWLKTFAQHCHRPQLCNGQGKQSSRMERRTEVRSLTLRFHTFCSWKMELWGMNLRWGICIYIWVWNACAWAYGGQESTFGVLLPCPAFMWVAGIWAQAFQLGQ